MEKNGKEPPKSSDLNTDELLKLVLITQLLEKINVKSAPSNCKNLENLLNEILAELKILKEECNLDAEHLKELIIKELKPQSLDNRLIEAVKGILKENKHDLEILIEERSNLVLEDLEEILRNNYANLVKLINNIHNSLAVKLVVAAIFFLAGVVVGSWMERFVLNKVVSNMGKELNIQNTTNNVPTGGKS
jgi:hypothetical protein